MSRFGWFMVLVVAAGIVLVAGTAAQADPPPAMIPLTQGNGVITNLTTSGGSGSNITSVVHACSNLRSPDCKSCKKSSGTPSPSKPGNSASCKTKTETSGLSYIDDLALNYHHTAHDYRQASAPGGCSSCGGGGAAGGTQLPRLEITRHHRYRDQTWQSSFGPGVYSNYDAKLAVYPLGAIGSGQYEIDMFDPQAEWPVRMFNSSGTTSSYVDTQGMAIETVGALHDHGRHGHDHRRG